MRLTSCLLAALIATVPPVLAQATAQDPSGEWQPEVETNAQLLQEAERAMPVGARPERGPRPGRGAPGGAGGPPPGGGDGPMGPPPGGAGSGPMGPPPGGARPGGARPSLKGLLPTQGAFAAPEDAVLVLQRMREAVVFGTSDGRDVVVVPLSGTLDLADGTRATLRDDGGRLTLQLDIPDGRRATYRYALPDAASGALRIDIIVEGDRLPGGSARLQRAYRRMKVDVAAPERASP